MQSRTTGRPSPGCCAATLWPKGEGIWRWAQPTLRDLRRHTECACYSRFFPLPAEGEAELFFGDFGPGGAGVVVDDAIEIVLGLLGHFADGAFGFKVVG